jgi:hypothetical protein
MRNQVMELLRKNLIDVALDNHDWDSLRLLTSENASDYVISPFYDSPFDFLCYDEHFFERRFLGDESGAILNYRYRDSVANKVYIGEIHIPINRQPHLNAYYRPRNKRAAEEILVPEWFTSLVSRAQTLLSAEE